MLSLGSVPLFSSILILVAGACQVPGAQPGVGGAVCAHQKRVQQVALRVGCSDFLKLELKAQVEVQCHLSMGAHFFNKFEKGLGGNQASRHQSEERYETGRPRGGVHIYF